MPRSTSARHVLPRTLFSTAVAQAAALLAVGAVGVTALEATSSLGPRAVRPASVQMTHPAVEAADTPRVLRPETVPPATVRHVAPQPVRRAKPPARPRARIHRWLPTGTGMWIYQWNRTGRGRAAAVVRRARQAGLTTLYVRTGSSHDGFTGAAVLRALMAATMHTSVHVVAWDFPELKNPKADARRLARAAWFERKAGHRVAAVAPDIETPSEGARSSAARVRIYMQTLRRLLPKDVAILATVPWPSKERLGHYPYATVAARSDALLPMAYWYNNSPQLVTARSVAYLRRFHKPVQPVGQGYDGKIDVPSLPHNNLRKQVPAFLATARKLHVTAVSLWSWQSAPRVSWTAIARAKEWFAPR